MYIMFDIFCLRSYVASEQLVILALFLEKLLLFFLNMWQIFATYFYGESQADSRIFL